MYMYLKYNGPPHGANNVTHQIRSVSRNLSHVVAFMNYPFPHLLDPDLPRPLDPRPLDPDLPRPRDLFLLPSGAPICFFSSARFWKVLPITPAKASAPGISTAEFWETRPVPLHALLMRLPRSPPPPIQTPRLPPARESS